MDSILPGLQLWLLHSEAFILVRFVVGRRVCCAGYPLVLILGVGIIKEDPNIRNYALPLAAIGAGIAFYHYLLQLGIITEKLAPCAEGISCLTRYETWLGFVTLPLLAFFAFVAVIVGTLIYKKGN
jgi:disulfide bond formation protein DsbB